MRLRLNHADALAEAGVDAGPVPESSDRLGLGLQKAIDAYRAAFPEPTVPADGPEPEPVIGSAEGTEAATGAEPTDGVADADDAELAIHVLGSTDSTDSAESTDATDGAGSVSADDTIDVLPTDSDGKEGLADAADCSDGKPCGIDVTQYQAKPTA